VSQTPTPSDAAQGEPPSDEELVRRVLAGDDAAARMLFDRHLPTLRARARARLPASLRGKLGESDVIQDAYLAAFRSLGDFEDRGDGSFAAWLRKILERRIVNEVRDGDALKRDARREVRIPTGTAGVGAALDQPSPSEEAMAEEDAAALRTAVAGLSADHRTVIRLVHDEGLTLVRAGERMGRSADAARKLYSRAVAELSARLRRPAAEDADSAVS
jgi:RNA polymerase sigma-70 factor (ECF subfamily)